jgi:hypothetical protein
MTPARIHIERIGKPPRFFNETRSIDDGTRLDTETLLDPEVSMALSQGFRADGKLSEGQVIGVIRKHHFYHEWFGIMEMCDPQGHLLGSYCDVLTPLRRVGNTYYLTDLLLDLWIWPDGRCLELDWDEFHAAEKSGLLAPVLARQAETTLKRMVKETRAGRFPREYL